MGQFFVSTRVGIAVALGAALLSPAMLVKAAPQDQPDVQGQRVAKRVSQLLRSIIKNQDGNPVSIHLSPTAKASQGYFSDVKISGGASQLKSIYVSEFQLHAENVQIDVPKLWNIGKVETKQAQTQLRVVISEQDLTRMLAHSKGTKNMNLKVKYVGDKMSITGVLNYPFVNGPISGLAKLRQTSDHNVYLDILSLQLRGVEAPNFIKNQLSSHINPVINYSDVPFSPPFRTVRVVGNKAILST